jgi:hypothetical protein
MTPYGGHIRPPEGVTVDPLFLWLCNEMGGFGIRANPGRELSTSSSYCAVRPLPPTRIRRIAPFAMSSRIARLTTWKARWLALSGAVNPSAIADDSRRA